MFWPLIYTAFLLVDCLFWNKCSYSLSFWGNCCTLYDHFKMTRCTAVLLRWYIGSSNSGIHSANPVTQLYQFWLILDNINWIVLRKLNHYNSYFKLWSHYPLLNLFLVTPLYIGALYRQFNNISGVEWKTGSINLLCHSNNLYLYTCSATKGFYNFLNLTYVLVLEFECSIVHNKEQSCYDQYWLFPQWVCVRVSLLTEAESSAWVDFK